MSRLLENSEQFRNNLLAKNSHTPSNEYDAGNPNALSDGDEKGKGLFNGNIGSISDIQARNTQLASNKFTMDRPYDASQA